MSLIKGEFKGEVSGENNTARRRAICMVLRGISRNDSLQRQSGAGC